MTHSHSRDDDYGPPWARSDETAVESAADATAGCAACAAGEASMRPPMTATPGLQRHAPAHERGSNPYDLHHAAASRLNAAKDLMLLERHLLHEPCPDCITKHALAAQAYLEEAMGLDGGIDDDARLAGVVADMHRKAVAGDRAGAAAGIRRVRRAVVQRLGLGHAHKHEAAA